MRLPNTAHEVQPWRIHEIAPDFRLEDVWALPTPGDVDDFALLVEGFATGDPERGPSRAVRVLFALRWKLGELLGWDESGSGIGTRVRTLRDRLPADLAGTSPPDLGALPFEPLYVTEDEFAAEIANRTMHGVLHLGWVGDGEGRYRGQMAVLVKPNGVLGRAYMTAILPFRRLVVYPQMMRQIEQRWHKEVALAVP